MQKPDKTTTVLVVDDDAGLRELIARTLSREGYDYIDAPDGNRAMEVAVLHRPSLIFLDYRLTDMTGSQVVESLGARGLDIPFIIMTGQGDERLAVEMMRLGAVDYLVKDSDFLDRLPAVLERALQSIAVTRRLAEAEAALRQQLEEKTLLLKEVHHRVKNNIAMISSLLGFSAEMAGVEEARVAIQEARGRVESIVKLYERLLQTDNYADLAVRDYLHELVSIILELSSGQQEPQIFLNIGDFSLNARQLFLLGLVLNELLTNALKYGLSGSEDGWIKIGLDRQDAHVVLTVEDNGRGLPEDFDMEGSAGFGLRLVEILAGQMEGSFSIHAAGGTICNFSFGVRE